MAKVQTIINDEDSNCAFLLLHLKPFCEACGSTETPQWRKGWHSDILGKKITLCNKCGLKYVKNQFCPYCMKIYSFECGRKFDSTIWIKCCSCNRLVHRKCEFVQKRTTTFKPKFYSYVCPDCSCTINKF